VHLVIFAEKPVAALGVSMH